ncbi:alpha/beta fold hydrolase [Plantactinospora sp. GCM10030261]|uniref:alpha/beta fold hydrolase n=1 Tax=Plantactinospora sp. GCM10030261 TaxID=3273420 RepID=UPI00361A86AB
MILIPGLGASRAFFDPLVNDLARDHRVVTVDLPGHGDRPAPARVPTLHDCAADLRLVIDGLGDEQVSLVGWSLGATVAWTYLREFGEDRVRRLVSVEQTPRLVTGRDWQYAAFGSLDEQGAQILLADVERDCGAFVESLITNSFAERAEPDPALLGHLVAEGRRAHPAAVHGLLSDVLKQDWRDRVAAIGVPTLLVHGSRSRVYPPEVGTWLAAAMPDARVEFLADSGHLCFVEQPQRFSAVLRDFLTTEEKA